MTFFVIIGFIVLALLLSRRRSTRSIGEVAPDTLIVTCSDGSTKEHEYSGETNSYYHEECAADYLCTPEKYTRVEIKDVTGKVYSYDHAAMTRLGWN